MTYKKKAAVLSVLLVVLAGIYILSFVFENRERRSAAFAWLDPVLLNMADGIEIHGSEGIAVLSRKNNVWVFSTGTADYPVKQTRVDDFLALLSRKDLYPLRASSSGAQEALSLNEERASRIRVLGGAGLPLLDLLVGSADALGREVYLRRAGRNEIYSGEDHFTLYTGSSPDSWYDLRLFPPDSWRGGTEAVQQADMRLPNSGSTFVVLRRSGDGWIIQGNEGADVDTTRVEAWLRSVMEIEADDFGLENEKPDVIEGSITLRLGDGTSRILSIGPADYERLRFVTVSTSPQVYVFQERTVTRLFRESSYFMK